MNRTEAKTRYFAACKKAGMTVKEMNTETYNLITDFGEAEADGHPCKGLTMEARVACAEHVAG